MLLDARLLAPRPALLQFHLLPNKGSQDSVSMCKQVVVIGAGQGAAVGIVVCCCPCGSCHRLSQ